MRVRGVPGWESGCCGERDARRSVGRDVREGSAGCREARSAESVGARDVVVGVSGVSRVPRGWQCGCRGPGARADVGIAVRVPCRELEWRARRAPSPRPPPPPPPPPPPQAAPWAGGWGPGAERAAAHTHLGAVGGRPPRSFTAAASGVPAGGERQASLLRPPRPPPPAACRLPPAACRVGRAGPGPPPRSAGRGRPPAAPRTARPGGLCPTLTELRSGVPGAQDSRSQLLAWGVCVCSAFVCVPFV